MTKNLKHFTFSLLFFLLSLSAHANAHEFYKRLKGFSHQVRELEQEVESNTRRLRMGSRRRRRNVVIQWKKSTVTHIKKLKEKTFQVREQLSSISKTETNELNKVLLSQHLTHLQVLLKGLLKELSSDHYPFEVYHQGNELYQAFKELEASGNFDDYKRDDGLDGLIEIKKKTVKFNSANHACHTLAMPGDIILRKALLIDGSTDNDFSPATLKWINFLEKIKGNDTELNYRHAEIITELEHYNNIRTTSYYPWLFNMMNEKDERKPPFLDIDNRYIQYSSYRTKYSMFRVKALTPWTEIRKKEMALARVKMKSTYARLGVCSDFVNWAYFHQISSNWNRIPLLKEAINILYLPEAISTPDNLADSYMTEKTCEVENSELIYPKEVFVKPWLRRLIKAKNSVNKKIKNHALGVLKLLKEQGVIDENENRVIDVISLDTKSEDYSDFLDGF